jgi:hypothetical protein
MKSTRSIAMMLTAGLLVSGCQAAQAATPTTGATQTATATFTATWTETPTATATDAGTPTPVPTASSTPQAMPERDTDAEFAIVDRPDDVDGYQIHFVYAIPSDGRDALLDVNGEIALSAEAMNRWFEGQTGTRLRYDTYNGELDITFMQFPDDTETIDDVGIDVLYYVGHQLKTSYGFDYSNKLYVVHYDGNHTVYQGYCGVASYPPEGPGQVALLMLRGYIPYWDYVCPRQFTKSVDYTGFFEMTILHELLHLMGMVPECAPMNSSGHVMDNPQDLMYYSYDGTYSPVFTYLDWRNNDYYNHDIPDCPDLADSVFLEPLPANAQLPPAWEESVDLIPENPLEDD